MFRTLVFALLFFSASSTYADSPGFWDGNRLVPFMREFEKAERNDPTTKYDDSARFVGYVAGVFDSISGTLCTSGTITLRQVTTIVAQYLNDNPAKWSDAGDRLVSKALQKSFPCR